ncbi:D-aminoacyl-tRNA deacylase [Mycena chlorophos]|uniref:D-aminoacyl-tRNA deacylase n=1 Tax=Mycena chlorophos TaxID=658473 RepID=A0A8H6TT27_MYCCL|nr:D-aminoacyl-tRNA deacylase [Mycena chlorophos]
MRAVIQRVSSASVAVDGDVIAQISRGLMVLVGIGRGKRHRGRCRGAYKQDVRLSTGSGATSTADSRPLQSLSLRVFADPEDETKMWKTSVKDIDAEVLCVSQFTLMAQTKKGSKPDFHNAMVGASLPKPLPQHTESNSIQKTEDSRVLYSKFLDCMRAAYKSNKIRDGRFGAMMNVSLTNEGPVTFTLDTREVVPAASGGANSKQSRPNKQHASSGATSSQSPDKDGSAT